MEQLAKAAIFVWMRHELSQLGCSLLVGLPELAKRAMVIVPNAMIYTSKGVPVIGSQVARNKSGYLLRLENKTTASGGRLDSNFKTSVGNPIVISVMQEDAVGSNVFTL